MKLTSSPSATEKEKPLNDSVHANLENVDGAQIFVSPDFERAIQSFFSTANDINKILQEYGTETMLSSYNNLIQSATRQTTKLPIPKNVTMVRTMVNLRLAEFFLNSKDYAESRDLFKEIIDSHVFDLQLESSYEDANEFANIMHTYGQLLSGIGIKDLHPPLEDVLLGKEKILVAMETYRKIKSPRFAQIMEELAFEYVSHGLNSTNLRVVIEYLNQALEYLASLDIDMTGTAEYNGILGKYYIAVGQLTLTQHYQLLRSLTQHPSKAWSYKKVTRASVQHDKLEAAKSLARVLKHWMITVKHFYYLDMSAMDTANQFDTWDCYQELFFEICKMTSQLLKTLKVVLELEYLSGDVRRIVPQEFSKVSGRGLSIFEDADVDEVDAPRPPMQKEQRGQTSARMQSNYTKLQKSLRDILTSVTPMMKELFKMSEHSILMLGGESSTEEEIDSLHTINASIDVPVKSSKLESLQDDTRYLGKGFSVSTLLPSHIVARILQQGHRENFIDNHYQNLHLTANLFEYLKRFPCANDLN